MNAFLNLLPPQNPETTNTVTLEVPPNAAKHQSGMLCCRTSPDSAIRHLCPLDGLLSPEEHSQEKLFETAVMPSMVNVWDGEDVSILINGDDAVNVSIQDITERTLDMLQAGCQEREMPQVFSCSIAGGIIQASKEAVIDLVQKAQNAVAAKSTKISRSNLGVGGLSPRAGGLSPRGGTMSPGVSPRGTRRETSATPQLAIAGRRYRSKPIKTKADAFIFQNLLKDEVPAGHSVLVHIILKQVCSIAPTRTANIRILLRRQSYSSSHFKDTLAAIGQYRASSQSPKSGMDDEKDGAALQAKASSAALLKKKATANSSSKVDESARLFESFNTIDGDGSPMHMILIESSSLDRILQSLELLAASKSASSTTELGNAAADIVAVTGEFVNRANELQEEVQQIATAIAKLHEDDHSQRQKILELTEHDAVEQVPKTRSGKPPPLNTSNFRGGAQGGVTMPEAFGKIAQSQQIDYEASELESEGTYGDDYEDPNMTMSFTGHGISDEILLKEEEIFNYETQVEVERKELRKQVAEAEAEWRQVSNLSLGIRKEISRIRTELSHRSYSAFRANVALQKNLEDELQKLSTRYFGPQLDNPDDSSGCESDVLMGRSHLSLVNASGSRYGTHSYNSNIMNSIRHQGTSPSRSSSTRTSPAKKGGCRNNSSSGGAFAHGEFRLPVNSHLRKRLHAASKPGSHANSPNRSAIHNNTTSMISAEELEQNADATRRELLDLYRTREDQLKERIAAEEAMIAKLNLELNHSRHKTDSTCKQYSEWNALLEEYCTNLEAVVDCYRSSDGTREHFGAEWLKGGMTRPITKLMKQSLHGCERALADAGLDVMSLRDAKTTTKRTAVPSSHTLTTIGGKPPFVAGVLKSKSEEETLLKRNLLRDDFTQEAATAAPNSKTMKQPTSLHHHGGNVLPLLCSFLEYDFKQEAPIVVAANGN